MMGASEATSEAESGASAAAGVRAEKEAPVKEAFDMEKDGWEDADCPCSDM